MGGLCLIWCFTTLEQMDVHDVGYPFGDQTLNNTIHLKLILLAHCGKETNN